MSATCKCSNDHIWSARVIEDSPEINYMEVEPSDCPECGAPLDEIVEVEYEHYEDDVLMNFNERERLELRLAPPLDNSNTRKGAVMSIFGWMAKQFRRIDETFFTTDYGEETAHGEPSPEGYVVTIPGVAPIDTRVESKSDFEDKIGELLLQNTKSGRLKWNADYHESLVSDPLEDGTWFDVSVRLAEHWGMKIFLFEGHGKHQRYLIEIRHYHNEELRDLLKRMHTKLWYERTSREAREENAKKSRLLNRLNNSL